jgi:hypothetical protein
VLGVLVLGGTALVVALTLALYPTAAPAAAPPRGSSPAPTPVPTRILVDDRGCQVDLSPALDQRLLCQHDLGPVWAYDHGLVAGPPTVLCLDRASVFGQVVPDPFPRFLDDGRRQVTEWLKVFPTAAAATVGYRQLTSSPACGADSGAVATPVAALVPPLGATSAQGFEVSRGPVLSDMMVIQAADALIQVSVTPLRSAPHDPDVVQLVAQVAVTRYLQPPAAASGSR